MMIPYKTMYCILCKSVSDALDRLPDSAENAAGKWVLQKGLLDAEELYLSGAEDSKEEQ